MTIKEEKPITMSEVVASAGESERAKAIKEFIKGFNKMPIDKAKKMKEELHDLNLMKLKESHVVKIVDFMPAESSELNKLVPEVSLDQEEITKILDVVRKY